MRLSLLANILAGSGARRLGVVAGLVAAVVAVAVVVARVTRLQALGPVQARTEIVVGGSAIVAAFILIPLLLQRDDPMDPRRFVLFGIPAPRLAFAALASSIVALPVLATAVFAVATVVAWSTTGFTILLAIVGAVLALLTCALCGRIFSAISALLLITRSAREIAGVVGIFILVLIAPGVVLLLSLNWGTAGTTFSQNLAQMLSFTPLGAAWALPSAAANDDAGGAFLCFLIAVVTVAVLWFIWRSVVALMYLSSRRESELRSQPASLGWFGRVPSTPAAAVAARSLTYWARDPRYYVPLVIIPIVPIILAIPLIVVDFPLRDYALIPLPIMCLFLGFAVHNDVALDNTAIWLHIVSGKRGVSDRVGRIAPVLMLGLPLIGIGSVATVFLSQNSAALPAVLGVSTCLLLASAGLGSLISARFPYAATRPGESPFTQPQMTGSTSVFVQLGTVVGTLLLASPSIVAAIQAITANAPDQNWVSLWWGVGVGVGVLALGIIGGGAVFNRRGPEILATSVRG